MAIFIRIIRARAAVLALWLAAGWLGAGCAGTPESLPGSRNARDLTDADVIMGSSAEFPAPVAPAPVVLEPANPVAEAPPPVVVKPIEPQPSAREERASEPEPKPKAATKPKQKKKSKDEPAAGPTNAAPESLSYRVQAGDSLKIEVYQEPDISRVYKVSEAGEINHPLLGKVTVAGDTLDAVEIRIRTLLAADYLVDPKVIITLEHWAERPVIVFGEVRTPGAFEVPPGEKMTLLQLVAKAGGFTDIAAIDRVRIVRPKGEDEETIRVRVSELLKASDHQDMDLLPGDVVIVPRTIF